MSGEFTIANHQSLATFLAMFGMMPEGNGLRLANDQKLFKPAKIHSGIHCVNNVRQLALVAHLYADDNADRLPPGPSSGLMSPFKISDERIWVL